MLDYIVRKVTRLIQMVLDSDYVRRFALRQPGRYQFILRRFSIKIFSGLPLTILFFTMIANLFLLFHFMELVINSKEFVFIDSEVASILYLLRSKTIAEIFYIITQAAGLPVIIFVSGIVLIYLAIRKKIHYIVAVTITLAGSEISIFLGKNIFKIGRPLEYSYYTESSFSFPSGHSTIAVAFYGLIVYMLIRSRHSYRESSFLFACGLVFILLIGFSRMYLGVHFLSDVIAGYLLGSLWLLSGISVAEWMRGRNQNF